VGIWNIYKAKEGWLWAETDVPTKSAMEIGKWIKAIVETTAVDQRKWTQTKT
jgi:hypothetical protein